MATPVLILWPDAARAGALSDALLRSGLGLVPQILHAYPERGKLAGIVSARNGPRAVIVGMSAQERALQALKDLNADSPGVVAVAAHDGESSELLRAVMRTGATDFLTPPFPAADVRRALEPCSLQPDDRREGLLIAVLPCQGTDGASTVALHVAQELSRTFQRPPLLADCDVQCGMLSFRLGVQAPHTLADVLAHADRLDEYLNKIAVRWRDIDLIAAPDSALAVRADEMQRLPQAIAVARRSYPAVIADLPPGMDTAGLQVALHADALLMVCTPAITSLHLARRRLSELLASGVDKRRLRIILNRADSRNGMDKRDVERIIGMPVYRELANDYGAVMQAAVEGGLVSSDSRLGRDLVALAAAITGEGSAAETKQHASGWKRLLRLG